MTLVRTLWKRGCVITQPRNWKIYAYSTNQKPEPSHSVDEPSRFTGSQAATWKAEYSRTGREHNHDTPPYQGIVVSLSVAVFLVYFCIFREESNIDEELGKTLYERIEGLEELQLQASLKYNLEKGLDIRAIEERLNQIKQEKQKRI